MKATLAQLNPLVGDVLGNVRKIGETYLDAEERGGDLVVFPELAVTGYPPEGLLSAGDVLDAVAAGLEYLRGLTRGRRAAMAVGTPVRAAAGIYNAAVVFAGGEKVGETRKKNLSVCGSFDEWRYFMPERQALEPVTVGGVRVGILIGADAWGPGPAAELKAGGAEVLVAMAASPFCPHVMEERVRDGAAQRVAETGAPFLYVNQVGGQDEWVFDGGSFGLDAGGKRLCQAPQWEECVVDAALFEGADEGVEVGYPDPLEETWRAMVVSVRDYVKKSGFSDVVLGLSGGIDSAVVAAVAGDAVGAERVHCVRLPGRYTSDLSNDSAKEMCRVWGFDMRTAAISPVVEGAVAALSGAVGGGELKKLTRENMQARARGYLLMTLSNEYGWLLLSTGNKSEIAVGYATLYGDMCGGFNPVKDVYKTMVFSLARWRNGNCPEGLLGPGGVVIPVEIIERAPSAELSEGQLDTDSLPPYSVLDGILGEMVEGGETVGGIAGKGFDGAVVERVYGMVKGSEYKRRQGAPGPRTGGFSGGGRLPLVNGFWPSQTAELRRMAEGK